VNFAIGKHAVIGATISIALTAGVKAEALPGVEFLRADQTITDFGGTPVKNQIVSGSPILDADGLPLQGNLDVIFKLNPAATNDYVVSGTPVSPGEAVTVQHDFSATSGRLELPGHVSGAGSVSADDYELTIINPGLVVWKIYPSDSNYRNEPSFRPTYPAPIILPSGNIMTTLGHNSSFNHHIIYTPSGDYLESYRTDDSVRIGGHVLGGQPLFTYRTDDSFAWIAEGETSIDGSHTYLWTLGTVRIYSDTTVFNNNRNRVWQYDLTTLEVNAIVHNWRFPDYRTYSGYPRYFPDWAYKADRNGDVGVATGDEWIVFDRGEFPSSEASDYSLKEFTDAVVFQDLFLRASGEAYHLENMPGFNNEFANILNSGIVLEANSLFIAADNRVNIVPLDDPASALVTTKDICTNGKQFRITSVNLDNQWALGNCGVAVAVAVNLDAPELYESPADPISITPLVPTSSVPFVLEHSRNPVVPFTPSSGFGTTMQTSNETDFLFEFL
jgi:hypothetical protein